MRITAECMERRTTVSDILALIAERKIREAMEAGQFDDLPGKGRPIRRDEELCGVPEELRMGYRILRNAGYLPPELELHRELLTLKDLLRTCTDEAQRPALHRRLTLATLHYNVLAERNRANVAFGPYADRLAARVLR
jgi:nitrogen fixation-related uncharacterized protein